MKRTLGIAALLAVTVTYAMGHKCFVGTERDKTELDCSGSCSIMTSTSHDVSDSVAAFTFIECDISGSILFGPIASPYRAELSDVSLNCVPFLMEPKCTARDGYRTCFCNTDLCNRNAASGVRPLHIIWLLAVSGLLATLFLH